MKFSKRQILWGGVSLGLLMIIIGGLIWINQTIRESLSPIRQTNQTLGTQVAQLLHPSPTVLPDPITIVREVRSLSRLETIQFTVEKVLTAEINQGIFGKLFGDKLLFVAHGYVIAGVDLEKMKPQDIWINGKVLYVRIPPAEVFVATLDNQKSYVYDRQTGLFSKGDPNLESTVRKAAEAEILKSALEDGILKQATINAENYLSRLLRRLGYIDVIFVEPEAPAH
ncbi:MAG TPA: DUF4230 domain-containing protein [Anaerolineaceae bacterium]